MIINEGRTSVKISNEEAQRQMNQFDEFYAEEGEEEAPLAAYVVAGIVIVVLVSAVVLSVLYWVWRLAHG
jgi:predicted ferric reductase